jgi:hypothetical protein
VRRSRSVEVGSALLARRLLVSGGHRKSEHTMFRVATLMTLCTALLFTAMGTTQAGQYGTAEEAKALLEKAVAAVKQDKAKALDMFNKGEGGFKDRDLYVSCANASDGIVTAHPYLKGEQLKDIKGKGRRRPRISPGTATATAPRRREAKISMSTPLPPGPFTCTGAGRSLSEASPNWTAL